MTAFVLGGAALAPKLGLGAAGGAALLRGLTSWLSPFGPGLRPVPVSPDPRIYANAVTAGARGRKLIESAKQAAVEIINDLLKETMEKSVTTPFALMALTDAIGYWIAADLIIKSTYHRRLHVPTSTTFVRAVDMIADTVAALMLVDLVSNRDIGSDLAESVVSSFSDAIVSDAMRAYIDTVAGIKAVDDDEIRDIIGEGAVASAEELAYIAARSGLDVFSAMAEAYTGLLQGDNAYWNRAIREIDDIMKKWERGLAADVYILASLIERIGEDLVDSVYWYLAVLDYVENRIKTVVRDVMELYAAYRAGGISENDLDSALQAAANELEAYREVLNNLVDDSAAESYVDDIIAEFGAFRAAVPFGVFQRNIELILDDVGRRLSEHAEVAREAYNKLTELRSVTVVAQ